jgi:hypothetical protein
MTLLASYNLGEKSQMECIDIARNIGGVCKDVKSLPLRPFPTSFLPIIDASTTLSDSNASSISPPPHLTPSPCQVEDSITVQPLPLSRTRNIEPDPISNTPYQFYDAHIVLLSKKLNLPDDVVSAAKRIIRRIQIDTDFQNLYSRPNKITSLLVARAALFAACRQVRYPKLFKEIEIDLPQNRKSSFHKVFKLIDSILKKDALTNPITEIKSNAFPLLFSIKDFISSQAKTIGLSDAIRDRAMVIAENSDVQNVFSGRRANIGAAVVLSFAAGCEKYFLDSVRYAQAANISTMTFTFSQKAFLKFVENMSNRNGELPPPFRVA